LQAAVLECSTSGWKRKACALDNAGIARILREIAALLEIKNENTFKIRAYRNGADIAANHPHALATLDLASLREIPGIGKDLAARIREIAETGGTSYHRELASEFPPSLLELMHLQGIGPKTAAMLYRTLGISTLEGLQSAATGGRLRSIPGMGIKKEALILKALEERTRYAGRHLLSETLTTADDLVSYLREHAPAASIEPMGSFRRAAETCGDLDLLASGAPSSLIDSFVTHPQVERVLGRGDTKASILLRTGFQVDLLLADPASRGAASLYFTGSKTHNIALRDRAIDRGCTLNEYGLFRSDDDAKIAGASEEEVYEALGLAWIPPELREGRGEIEAAAAGGLPALVGRADLRGDLHMHSTATDGKDDIRAMAAAARDAGLEYIAISDHSQSLAMANGLDEAGALEHAERIRAIDREMDGIRILAGIECDIRPDGTMDLADECLASLDLVVASVHSAFNQDRRQVTERILRAVENPHVDILGHPTGRSILKREPYPVDLDAVIDRAVALGVALEINSQPHRLDLKDTSAKLARDRGANLVVSSDAHSTRALGGLRWGVAMARRAWLEPRHILNTRPFNDFRVQLRRNRP
jgi:DNA polymerase (family 10)